MKKATRFLSLATALVLATVLVLTGCGGGGSSSTAAPSADPAASTEGSSAPASTAEGGSDDLASMSWDEIVEEAKTTKKLVFSAWWGEEYFKPVTETFKEEYGIEVELVKAEAKDIADKLQVEQSGNASIDCFLVGGAPTLTLVEEGLLYGPLNTLLPEADKLDPTLSSVQEGVLTDGYLIPMYRNQTGLLYDPRVVETPPQTWEDLVAFIQENPMKFGVCDPNMGGSGEAFVQTVITNICGDPDKYQGDTEVVEDKVADWDDAWQWINDNKANITITTSNKDSISRLNQGELSLVVAWDDDTNIAHNNGEIFKEAKLYVPEMGMPGGGDTLGIAKNSANKAASLLFISYLTSADEQVKMNEVLGSFVARTDLEGKATNTLLTADDLSRTRPWFPAPYKSLMKEDFTKKILMQ